MHRLGGTLPRACARSTAAFVTSAGEAKAIGVNHAVAGVERLPLAERAAGELEIQRRLAARGRERETLLSAAAVFVVRKHGPETKIHAAPLADLEGRGGVVV